MQIHNCNRILGKTKAQIITHRFHYNLTWMVLTQKRQTQLATSVRINEPPKKF